MMAANWGIWLVWLANAQILLHPLPPRTGLLILNFACVANRATQQPLSIVIFSLSVCARNKRGIGRNWLSLVYACHRYYMHRISLFFLEGLI